MSLDMIPTHYPFEDMVEAQEITSKDTVNIEVIANDAFQARQAGQVEFLDDTDINTDLLAYDIDQEVSPREANDTIFVRTDSNQSDFALLQPSEKVKKTWYNHLQKLENKVDPLYAFDQPCYTYQDSIVSLDPSVIQATYMGPTLDNSIDSDTPHFLLSSDLEIQGKLPSGLPIQILFDTGSHKTILNRKFLQKHPTQFANFHKIPLQQEHKIRLPSGQIIYADGLLALPVIIHGHLFQFLVLVATFAEHIELVIGIESLIQLESSLFLADSTLSVTPRSIPLYPTSEVTLVPKEQTLIYLQGTLPNQFSSGYAITHILPLDPSLSILTVESEFINQSTCFLLKNTSDRIHTFNTSTPFGYFDPRSIGYYEPLQASQILQTKPIVFPASTTSSFSALISDSSNIIPSADPPQDTQDPYPWLDLDDPRRFKSDRTILEETIDLSQSCLKSQEKRQFYDLLTEYSDVFSLRDEIGLAPNMHVELEMLDKKPFFIRPFSVKENIKPKIDKEMEKLTVLGILKKGLSGYSSPAMPIPRKNSDIPRIVADFRYLNTKLLQLNMSFPLVKECIQQIGASQCEVMSVIDLRDAYHTLRLSPSSQQFCGITPYYGSDTYLYQRLPMGLKVSPAIWQAFINKVLGPIPHRQRHIAIMDDCLVHSKRVDHLQDLVNLFESLRHHGLKISPKKCQFFRTSLIYMGYRFLIDDGKPSFTAMKDKCEAIRALETPKNVRDCRKFCGMVNFLSTFLPDLQKHLIPIYNLTRKNQIFKWNDESQKAFDLIKLLLIKPPVLRMPNTVGLSL